MLYLGIHLAYLPLKHLVNFFQDTFFYCNPHNLTVVLGTKTSRSILQIFTTTFNSIRVLLHTYTHTPPIVINQIATAVEFLASVKTRCGF